MRYFFKTTRFKVLLGIAGGLLVMMIIVRALSGWASPQSGIIGAIVTPVQRLASDVSAKIKNTLTVYRRVDRLEEENERLREELGDAVSKIIDYEQVKNENELLRKFYQIQEEHPDFKMQPARRAAFDPEDPFGGFTIDQGSMKGISPGDPVISSDGALVGRIHTAAPTYSTVITVLAPEPEMNISAIDSRTMEAGSVSGTPELAKEGLTKLSYLSRQSSVTVGDYVITAGVGGLFPKGLLIGTVEEIRQDSQSSSKYATIRPAARFKETTEVMVILSFDGQK